MYGAARGRAVFWRAAERSTSAAETRWRAISPGWSERAAAFADDPRAANLVGIKPGRMTGNWRDSEQGLGRGRYAYDINAALVPAALEAAAKLHESGLLETYLDGAQRRMLAQAGERARVWTSRAPALFEVEVPARQAREAVARYAKQIGVDDERAVDA